MPTLHWIGKEKVINHHLDIPFKVLEHAYGFDNGVQTEVSSPLERAGGEAKHFLGKQNNTGYYLNYEANEVTTLDHDFLSTMKTKADQYVIYADNCLLTKEYMTKHQLIFKKIPRDITRF